MRMREVCSGRVPPRKCRLFTPTAPDVTSATFCERQMPQNAARTCRQRALQAGLHGDQGGDRHPVGIGQVQPEGDSDGDRQSDSPDQHEQDHWPGQLDRRGVPGQDVGTGLRLRCPPAGQPDDAGVAMVSADPISQARACAQALVWTWSRW